MPDAETPPATTATTDSVAGANTVLALLRRRRQIVGGQAILTGLAGVAILLLMVTLTAGILAFILNVLLGLFFDVEAPFGWIWLLVALALIPLLFWYERQTHGEYYSDAVAGSGSIFEARSYGEYELTSTTHQAAAYVELLLTGPRFVLEAIGLRQGGSGGEATVERAAEAAKSLYAAGAGVQIASLVQPGESIEDVRAALTLLERVDWIGRSADGRRVWLGTEAKQYLEQNAIDLPPKAGSPAARAGGQP